MTHTSELTDIYKREVTWYKDNYYKILLRLYACEDALKLAAPILKQEIASTGFGYHCNLCRDAIAASESALSLRPDTSN